MAAGIIGAIGDALPALSKALPILGHLVGGSSGSSQSQQASAPQQTPPSLPSTSTADSVRQTNQKMASSWSDTLSGADDGDGSSSSS